MIDLEKEIGEELVDIFEVAIDLVDLYQEYDLTDFDLFIQDALREDIPGEFYKVSNDILIESAKLILLGVTIDEDKLSEFKTKLKQVWPKKKEHDDFMESEPEREVAQYRGVISEIVFECKLIAEKYETPMDLEKFLEDECTCHCGKCNPDGKHEQIMKEIYKFCTKHIIEKHVMSNQDFHYLIDKFKEGQQDYYKRELLKPKNLN